MTSFHYLLYSLCLRVYNGLHRLLGLPSWSCSGLRSGGRGPDPFVALCIVFISRWEFGSAESKVDLESRLFWLCSSFTISLNQRVSMCHHPENKGRKDPQNRSVVLILEHKFVFLVLLIVWKDFWLSENSSLQTNWSPPTACFCFIFTSYSWFFSLSCWTKRKRHHTDQKEDIGHWFSIGFRPVGIIPPDHGLRDLQGNRLLWLVWWFWDSFYWWSRAPCFKYLDASVKMFLIWQMKKIFEYLWTFSLHFLLLFALWCFVAVFNLYACSLVEFLWWKF